MGSWDLTRVARLAPCQPRGLPSPPVDFVALDFGALVRGFSTFLMPQLFSTVPCVVMTPNSKASCSCFKSVILLLLLRIRMWTADMWPQRGCNPQVENCCPAHPSNVSTIGILRSLYPHPTCFLSISKPQLWCVLCWICFSCKLPVVLSEDCMQKAWG